jgi:hypothetical protein
MLKRTTLGLFALVLLLGAGNALVAQAPPFSVSTPTGTIEPLTEDMKVSLRNAAELSEEELAAALEKSSCSGEKNADFCYACTDFNCTGTCYAIPCGFYINAKDQVLDPPPAPPVAPAGFLSIQTGCTTNYVSTCNDLNAAPPCEAFRLVGFPAKQCLNWTGLTPLQSVGCTTP